MEMGLNKKLTDKDFAMMYLYEGELSSNISKIRQIGLNDPFIREKTDKLYEITKELNDYIYKKLP